MTKHPTVHHFKKVFIFSLIIAFMFSLFPANIIAAVVTPVVSNEVIEFSQFNNSSQDWVNGILNKNQTEYYEGMSSPQRIVLNGLSSGLVSGEEYNKSLTIKYQFTEKGNYAYDFLTSWDQAINFADRIGDQTWTDGWKWNGLNKNEFSTEISAAIPDNTSPTNSELAKKITAYESIFGDNRQINVFGSGSIHSLSISSPAFSGNAEGTSHYSVTINWSGTANKVMILFGAHIAAGYDFNPEEGIAWGPEDAGASAISGAPYHVTLVDGGSQDNQIQIHDPKYNEPVPSISIDKVTNGSDGPSLEVDELITWTYTVTNEGNISLGDILVTDNKEDLVTYQSGDLDKDGRLDTNETWIYTATGTASEGLYENTGTVTGKISVVYGNEVVSDTDDSSYTGYVINTDEPGILINKVTNGSDGPSIEVGADITWTYTVSNAGNVPLSNIQVTDNMEGTPDYVSGDTNENELLDTDETWIFEATGTATEGLYENTGTASGSPPQGDDVSDSDNSSYTGYVIDDDDDDDDDDGDDDDDTPPTLLVESAVIPTLEVHAGEIPQTGDTSNAPFAAGGLLFLLFSGLGLYGWFRKELKESES